MKIVVTSDSYKESMSWPVVAQQIETGSRGIFRAAKVLRMPVADGRKETAWALIAATAGEIRRVRARGALGSPVGSFHGVRGDFRAAVVAAAAAATNVRQTARSPAAVLQPVS